MNSKSPKKEDLKIVEVPEEVVKFSIDNRYLGISQRDVNTLRCDILKLASQLKNCKVINLDVKEGHSRVVVFISITAACKTEFTGLLADYKNDLKNTCRLIDEGVLDLSVAAS